MNTKNIVKETTWYKSLSNLSCIDPVITNSSSSFQHNINQLTEFSKNGLTVLKQTFQRSLLNELVYRDCKYF